MIELTVYPMMAVMGQTFDDDTMVISIMSPRVEHPLIHCKNVYQFHFHDITEEYFLERSNEIIRPMNYETAQEIAHVACQHRDKKRWIIHCEAGISRSPGVAIGLSRYIDFNMTTRKIEKAFPHHNKHVRKLVEAAMREETDRLNEEYLKTKNTSLIDPHGF